MLADAVDKNNNIIGTFDLTYIHKNLLYHRSICILVINKDDNSVILSKREDEKKIFPRLWDVTISTHVRSGETYNITALREIALRLNIKNFESCETVSIPAKIENGFEFCELYYYYCNDFSNTRLTKNYEIIPIKELIDRIYNFEHLHTLNLIESVYYKLLDDIKFRELKNAIKYKIQNYFNCEYKQSFLPSYQTSIALSDDYFKLLDEIKLIPSSQRKLMIPEFITIFDNQRKYYPAPEGLEIGPIVLGSSEINDGIKYLAKNIESISNEIRLIGKKKSGVKLADCLEKELLALNVNFDRLDIKTQWNGHGNAEVISTIEEDSLLQPKLNIICDLMISSGVSAQAIVKEVKSRGGGDLFIVAALVSVNKPRIFNPASVLACCTVNDNDWLVGFNSDALSNGVEVGRNFPFIAKLKPKGFGFRNKLISDLEDLI